MILPSARTIFYTKPFVWQHDVWNRSTHHHATFANFEEAEKKITCNICNMANGMVLIRDCRWLVLMMTLNFVFFFPLWFFNINKFMCFFWRFIYHFWDILWMIQCWSISICISSYKEGHHVGKHWKSFIFRLIFVATTKKTVSKHI